MHPVLLLWSEVPPSPRFQRTQREIQYTYTAQCGDLITQSLAHAPDLAVEALSEEYCESGGVPLLDFAGLS